MSATPAKTTVAEMSVAAARMESIKAGFVGAITVCGGAGLAWLGAIALPLPLPLPGSFLEWLVNLAVALSSGFFFGVTYRYIVRQDDNLHLGSGAVGAFAFVRSLAHIEAAWHNSFDVLPWLLVVGESFLWFAAARYALDWAIGRQLVKPID